MKDRENKAQRSQATCPMSHSKELNLPLNTAPSFAARPPSGPHNSRLQPHTFPRKPEAQKSTYLAVYHLGMLEDGNDVTHHSHAQLVHDFLIEI